MGLFPRKHVTVLNFFPAFLPPSSGGELRYFHVCKNLGRYYEIEMVSPTHHSATPETVEISEGVVEHRIPKTWRHLFLHRVFEKIGRFPECSAVVVSLASRAEGGFRARVRDVRSRSDVVIHEHPFLFRHARKRRGQLLVYDAHNVEADLQASMLRGPLGRILCRYVRRLEALACREADVIFATSEEDKARLTGLYGVGAGKVFIAPNGVDVGGVTYASPAERAAARRQLGLDGDDVLLFIGSFHPPNIEGVDVIVSTLAPRLPEKVFLVAGSVCAAFARGGLPANAMCLGRVSDDAKRLLLQAADVGLNPMSSGSGTNLKMLEYLAAGVPAVSTPIGARGLDLVSGEHAIVCAVDEFPEKIQDVLGNRALGGALRHRGRQLVEEKYDWAKIGRRMYEVIESAVEAGRRSGRAR